MLLYRALLYLFPSSWRAEFGSQMCEVFASRRREASGLPGMVLLWLETLPDLLLSALAVHTDLFVQDLKYSVRALRRSPGFAVMVVAIMTAGIGATSAAFTLVNHVLLAPFPYARQDRLAILREDDLAGLDRYWDVSPANYRDWKRMSRCFEDMGAYHEAPVNITGGHGEPQYTIGSSVTAEMFPTLGVTPFLGRTFTAEDDRESSARTAILSYGLWQQRYGGSEAVLGRTIYLDGVPYTVIGVMARNFYFPTREVQLWTTMRWDPAAFDDRTNTYIFPVGRLKNGVTLEQARAELKTIAARLARSYPKELAETGISVSMLRDDIPGRPRLVLKVLLGSALCLLLITATNLANLMLARAITRRRELAVRTALGAGRERLIRQVLTESLFLAIPGGLLGILLAQLTIPVLVRLVPVELPLAETPVIDLRVVLFTAFVTFVTAIAFGVAPALRTSKTRADDLRSGGRSGANERRERLRSGLVVVEIACSVLLLAAFGLFTHALARIHEVDPGFRPDHVLTLRTSLPMPRYETPEAREPYYRHVLESARRLPGVVAAGYTSFLPMAFGGGIWPVEIKGRPETLANQRTASLRFITPGFFSALRIPLLGGRDVRETDSHHAPFVALVSRSFVDRYWPNENPIGHHINIANHDRTVIGIVGDVRVRGPERTSEPQVYVSYQQSDDVSTWYAPKDLVVRTRLVPNALIAPLRKIIHEADPDQPIADVRTLDTVVNQQTAPRRIQLAVLGGFGALALLLAAIGIHALLAFSVSSRIQEIGVRMALGARHEQVVRMIAGDAFKLAAAGIGIGLMLVFICGRLLQALLAGVKPTDPATLVSSIVVALTITLLGAAIPALRAGRVDPATAMRAD